MRRFSIHGSNRLSPVCTEVGASGAPEQGDKTPYTSMWESAEVDKESNRVTSVPSSHSKNCTNIGHEY